MTSATTKDALQANLTIFESIDPPILTKSFNLVDGKLKKEGGGVMSSGKATVKSIATIEDFAGVLTSLKGNQALSYGTPVNVPVGATVQIVTENNKAKNPKAISRTKENFTWNEGPGILMLDYDPPKGDKALDRGAFLELLSATVPGVGAVKKLWYPSASSHIVDNSTGKDLTGLRGQRVYFMVEDSRDIERAGAALFNRLYLAGHGHIEISAAGGLLTRAIVDGCVWQTNRLDFAAGAECVKPLKQNRGKPAVIPGELPILDSKTAIPDLTAGEKARLEQMITAAKKEKEPAAKIIKEKRITEKIVQTLKEKPTADRKEVERQVRQAYNSGKLEGDFTITIIDGSNRKNVTVDELLGNPKKYNGADTLDPIEPEYNDFSTVGRLYLDDGKPNIHSMAHGGRVFNLVQSEAGEQEPEPNPALSLEASSCVRFFENEPKPREFIVKDFLPRLNVGVIAAPGGTGKGYFTLQLALSVAAGIKFLGKFDIENPGGVLYCNAEDDEPEIHRRFLGCLREVVRGMGADAGKEAVGALAERFYAPSLTGKHRLTLYPDKTGANKRDLLNLARAIPDLRLIILDPANRIMAGDFNRVEEVTAFIQTLEEIATETGATILLITHTNKASQTGDRDSKHSAGAVLGSQSFVNAARWVMTLSTFDESMRKKLQFTGDLDSFVSLRIPKANYLAPGLGELHLKRVTDLEDEAGLGSGPLRLVDLGKKEKEVTSEDVAHWVDENPGVSKTAVVDAIKGKFGASKQKTRNAVDMALKTGFIKEERDPVAANKKIIVPGYLTAIRDEEQNSDE